MRKLILYIATSIDGKIARTNGDVDFLDNYSSEDYGYDEFDREVDTVIMGYNTYEKSLSFPGKPFQGKEYFVITSKKEVPDDKRVIFVNEDFETFYTRVSNLRGRKSIWLMGGGGLIRSVLNSSIVINEMLIFTVPLLLGEGIPTFPSSFPLKDYILKEVKSYKNSMVLLHYKNK